LARKRNSRYKPRKEAHFVLKGKLEKEGITLRVRRRTGAGELSEVLMKYATPFLDQTENRAHRKMMLELAIQAWNLSLLPPKVATDQILEMYLPGHREMENPLEHLSEDILAMIKVTAQLVAHKNKHYKDDRRLVVSHHIEEGKKDFYLEVASAQVPPGATLPDENQSA